MDRSRMLALAAMLIIFLAQALAPQSDASPVFIVRVDIKEETVSFDVGPSGNGSGSIMIRVYLPYPNNPLMEKVEVVLETAQPAHVNIYLSTYEITLSRDRSEAHLFGNMSVAPSTSSLLAGKLVITGTAKVYPSGASAPVEGDEAHLRILPFYGADLFFPTPFGKMAEGETKIFAMRVNNTGNANDAYQLSVVDDRELRANGIYVKFDKTSVEVPEGGSILIDVEVTAKDARRGSYLLRIEARSAGKGGEIVEDSTAALTITVERKVISFLQGTVFSNIYFLWGVLILLLVLTGLSCYGSIRLFRYLKWKRDFKRMIEGSADDAV